MLTAGNWGSGKVVFLDIQGCWTIQICIEAAIAIGIFLRVFSQFFVLVQAERTAQFQMTACATIFSLVFITEYTGLSELSTLFFAVSKVRNPLR